MNNRTHPDPLTKTEADQLTTKRARHYKFAHLLQDTHQVSERITGTLPSACAVMDELVDLYARSQGRTTSEADFWVEHSPNNLASSKILLQAYPEAKFIHIIRDGRAVYNSAKKVSWGPKTPLRGAQWWLQKLAYCFAAELLHPDQVYRVKYENLLLDPETTLRGVCEFIGMPFSSEMLQGDSKFIADYTKGQHRHVGQGIVASRLDSYRSELPAKEIEHFELFSAKMLDQLGYAVDTASRRPGIGIGDRINYVLREAFHKSIANPVRNYLRKRK
jgi:hypothetical protein